MPLPANPSHSVVSVLVIAPPSRAAKPRDVPTLPYMAKPYRHYFTAPEALSARCAQRRQATNSSVNRDSLRLNLHSQLAPAGGPQGR